MGLACRRQQLAAAEGSQGPHTPCHIWHEAPGAGLTVRRRLTPLRAATSWGSFLSLAETLNTLTAAPLSFAVAAKCVHEPQAALCCSPKL